MIFFNKNPVGFFMNLVFGICQLIDSLVRVLSFGMLFTSIPINCSRWQAKAYHSKQLKRGVK